MVSGYSTLVQFQIRPRNFVLFIQILVSESSIRLQFINGVHDHDVLDDLLHFPEGDKMHISSKLEHYYANEVDIRNQRF